MFRPTNGLLLGCLLGFLPHAPLAAVEIVAHRGASYDAPENTMVATRLAWEQAADAVETDVMLTRDRKLIVFHDRESSKRTTGCDAPMASLTQAEARDLDAGSWRGARFAGEKIPLLEEQIASLPHGRKLVVEIKGGREVVPILQQVLETTGATTAQIAIISFDYDALKSVRQQLPGYPTLYLAGYRPPATDDDLAHQITAQLADLISQARRAKFTGLDLQHTWPLTPKDVAAIHAAGLQLHVWTVNDVTTARQWIDLGVASITTDRPGWLRAQLGL